MQRTINNKNKTIEYIYSRREQKRVDEYDSIRKMHMQAVMELSERNKPMNNKLKWCDHRGC